jgi:hypothetical protein
VADQTETTFEGWAVLELMGHRRLAGYVTEVELAGKGMLRIDVPAPEGTGPATQFYSPTALYCLTPTTEDIARAFAEHTQPEPVHRWELPAPARTGADDEDIDFG